MSKKHHSLRLSGTEIPLRRFDNVRLVTPKRDTHPAYVSARLAQSTRLALDPTYSRDHIVLWGQKGKFDEFGGYDTLESSRAGFHDPDGNLILLTDEILIRFIANSTDEQRERLLSHFPGRIVERGADFWRFRVEGEGKDARAEDAPLVICNLLDGERIVEYAEPDALIEAVLHTLPQDEPQFGNQWHLLNTGQKKGLPGADIDALGAWAITTGSPEIAVAVHDTGVDVGHPDLSPNIGPGWDFVNDDSDPSPDSSQKGHGHGTACAGIIAAAANGIGVSGVAPGCKIVPVRIWGARTVSAWTKSFEWAAANARVVSCSYGVTPFSTITNAINKIIEGGTVVVAASGNDGEHKYGLDYPASLPGVIAVGSSTNLDVRASYSQYGEGLDILAPGGGRQGTLTIETTDVRGADGFNPGGDYCYADGRSGQTFAGTSASAPVAAGVVALMLSANPRLTPAQVKSILCETAEKIQYDDAGAQYEKNPSSSLYGWSPLYGYGRINARRAVEKAKTVAGAGSGTTTHAPVVSQPSVNTAPSVNTPPPVSDTPAQSVSGTSDLLSLDTRGTLRLHAVVGGALEAPKMVQRDLHYVDYLVGNWTGNGKVDIIARAANGDMFLYPFDGNSYENGLAGRKVGSGFAGYTHYLVGNWLGDGTDDLIVRTDSGDMLLFNFSNNAFSREGIKVANGLHSLDYMVGNWTGTGTDDLIVRVGSGDLLLFPFQHGTFYVPGAGQKVGTGFGGYTHFLVGNWTGDGTADLVVRTRTGEMLLFPFRNNTFRVAGAATQVGHGINSVDYFVGDWTGDGTDDLIVRTYSGNLHLFLFRNGTFYNQNSGKMIGSGFNYKGYMVTRGRRR